MDSKITSKINENFDEAERLSKEDRFNEAFEKIKACWRLPGLDDEWSSNIQTRQEGLLEARQKRIKELTDELNALTDEEEPSQDDLDKGQNICNLLDKIAENDIGNLFDRWDEFRKRSKFLMEKRNFDKRAGELWQEPLWQLDAYDEALALAKDLAANYSDEPVAKETLIDAEEKRKKAYEAQHVLYTAAQLGDYEGTLKTLETFQRQGDQELPLYEPSTVERDGKKTSVLKEIGRAPSDEALKRMRDMAQNFADQKADEYILRARGILDESPDRANEQFEEAKAFNYLSQQKIEDLNIFYNEEILPGIERRKKTRELVEKLENEALRTKSKLIEQAWHELDELEKNDPLAKEIKDARKDLSFKYADHLQDELRRAGETRKSGEFENALESAQKLADQIRDQEELQSVFEQAEELLRECQSDRELLESVNSDVLTIRELAETNLDEAVLQLETLEQKVQAKPERFRTPLSEARLAVQSRQTLENLLTEWENRFRRLAPIRLQDNKALREGLDELETLEQEIGNHRREYGKTPEFNAFESHVQARKLFIEGRLAWESGSYRDASIAWEKSLEFNIIDVQETGEWLKKAEQASEVMDIIDQANDYRQEENFKDATELLDKWRSRPSPKKQEVADLYREIKQEWTEKLHQEVLELAGNWDNQPMYDRMVSTLDKLNTLAPEIARDYQKEYLPTIYEEWGDVRTEFGIYDEAEEYYQKALALLDNKAPEKIRRTEIKRQRVRRQRVHSQVNELVVQGRNEEANKKLSSWISQDPDDPESLARQVELFLEDQQTDKADIYLKQLERLLNTEQNYIFSRTGIEDQEEIIGWQMRSEIFRKKTDIMKDIRRGKEQIRRWLWQGGELREYRLAREARDNLIENTNQVEKGENFSTDTLPPMIRKSVQRDIGEFEQWLEDQTGTNGTIHQWYDDVKHELAGHLETELDKTRKPELSTSVFQASFSPEIIKRWNIGLKICLVSEKSSGAKIIIKEITDARIELDHSVKALIEDPYGPDQSPDQESLEPLQALEIQLSWCNSFSNWAEGITNLLEGYDWASESDKPERTVSKNIQNIITEHRSVLRELKNAVNSSERQIQESVSVGREGEYGWNDLDWTDLIRKVLILPHVPGPLEHGKEQDRTQYWKNLENDNTEIRLKTWQETGRIMQNLNDTPRSVEAVIKFLDSEIRNSRIEENWEGPLPCEDEKFRALSRHRSVRWAKKKRSDAKKIRDELLWNRLFLFVYYKAERFRLGLRRMEVMEKCDRDDEYGFRTGYLITGSEPLDWEELRNRLEECKKQFEIYHDWKHDFAKDTLGVWRKTKHTEFTGMIRQARYKEAKELLKDVLEGDGDYRAKQLGPDYLALTEISSRLENPPNELKFPLSHDFDQTLKKLEIYHQYVKKTIGQLLFWLKGEGGQPESEELNEPVEERERKFKDQKDYLEGALNALSGWGKKKQKEMCRHELARLRRLAPDYPELDEYEIKIEEA